MSEKQKTPFARFFSCIPGHVVSRYGSLTRTTGPRPIGVTKTSGGAWNWHPEIVVALTETEARLYRREYDRAVNGGVLRERTEADYLAFIAEDAKKVKAARSKPPAKPPEGAQEGEQAETGWTSPPD